MGDPTVFLQAEGNEEGAPLQAAELAGSLEDILSDYIVTIDDVMEEESEEVDVQEDEDELEQLEMEIEEEEEFDCPTYTTKRKCRDAEWCTWNGSSCYSLQMAMEAVTPIVQTVIEEVVEAIEEEEEEEEEIDPCAEFTEKGKCRDTEWCTWDGSSCYSLQMAMETVIDEAVEAIEEEEDAIDLCVAITEVRKCRAGVGCSWDSQTCHTLATEEEEEGDEGSSKRCGFIVDNQECREEEGCRWNRNAEKCTHKEEEEEEDNASSEEEEDEAEKEEDDTSSGSTTTTESTLSCPNTLDQFMKIPNSDSTLYYAVVPDSPSESGNGILCARLEGTHNGWTGLGFSPDGTMSGQAVVGIPTNGTVLKYDLDQGSATPMDDRKQTLRDTSISEENGRTIITFTKLLEERGEVPISLDNENQFLHAWGGDDFKYHGPRARTSFTIDFGSSSAAVEQMKNQGRRKNNNGRRNRRRIRKLQGAGPATPTRVTAVNFIEIDILGNVINVDDQYNNVNFVSGSSFDLESISATLTPGSSISGQLDKVPSTQVLFMIGENARGEEVRGRFVWRYTNSCDGNAAGVQQGDEIAWSIFTEVEDQTAEFCPANGGPTPPGPTPPPTPKPTVSLLLHILFI